MTRLLPYIVAGGVVACAVALAQVRRFPRGSAFASGMTGTIAVIAACYVTRDWSCELFKVQSLKPQGYFLGQESASDYIVRLDRTGVPELGAWFRHQIQQGQVRPDAKVLLIADYKGYLLPLDFFPDDNLYAYRWNVEVMKAGGDLDQLQRRLQKQDIEFIAVNLGQIEWFHSHEPRLYQRESLAFALYYFQRLLRGHARLVYNVPGMVVMQVGAPPGTTAIVPQE
jgi:hypothetical protein